MHIVEIPSFFPPYGGTFCVDQAKALMRLGHQVDIVSNVQIGLTKGLRDYLLLPWCSHHIDFDCVSVDRHFMRGIPKMVLKNADRWIKQTVTLFDRYVAEHGVPDILHAHCCKWGGYAAMLLSRKYHIPYVITEHLSYDVFREEFSENTDAWQIPMLREAYESADMVVPVAKELVDNLAPLFGKNYRWQWISNTIDTDFFHYVTRDSREEAPYTFCCLANFWPLKGYDILLKAFDQLPENTRLVVAGTGTESKSFGELCRSFRRSQYVTSLGNIDREGVRELLFGSDCLVLASRSEAQSLSLLEAMSTGLPVVTTEALPQNLRIDGGCHVVPIDDADAMAQKMLEVMSSTDFDGKRLSEQIYMMASPEVVGKKLETLFLQFKQAFPKD